MVLQLVPVILMLPQSFFNALEDKITIHGFLRMSATEGEGGYVFTPFCMFVCYLQNRIFFKYIVHSILLFCLSVYLFVANRLQFQTDLHETSPHGRVFHKKEA